MRRIEEGEEKRTVFPNFLSFKEIYSGLPSDREQPVYFYIFILCNNLLRVNFFFRLFHINLCMEKRGRKRIKSLLFVPIRQKFLIPSIKIIHSLSAGKINDRIASAVFLSVYCSNNGKTFSAFFFFTPEISLISLQKTDLSIFSAFFF